MVLIPAMMVAGGASGAAEAPAPLPAPAKAAPPAGTHVFTSADGDRYVVGDVKEVPLCPALKIVDTYKNEDNEDYAMLIAGKDGWLFRSRLDLKFRFLMTDRTEDSFRRLNDAFKYYGTDLVVAMLPTRGITEHDSLLPPYSNSYDAKTAAKNYLAMIEDMRGTGIRMADMTGVDAVSNFFLKRDNHWTDKGAAFTAEAVAKTIKGLPVYKSLEKTGFETSDLKEEVLSSHRYGEFIQQVCGTEIPRQPHEKVTKTAEKGKSGVSDSDLFGSAKEPEIALLGTSQSTDPEPSYANFEGHMEQLLGVRIANEAISGGSLQGSIGNYLIDGDFKRAKPKVVIWEMGAHYGFNQQSFLREIVPAVFGQCEAKDARAAADVAVEGVNDPVIFQGLADKKLKSHKYYVVLDISDKSQRMVKVKFTHADGRTDTVKLERSVRNFPINSGIFFAELSDVMVAPLDQVSLSLKKPSGTVKAKICQIPAGADKGEAIVSKEKDSHEVDDVDEPGVLESIREALSKHVFKRSYALDGSRETAEKAPSPPVLPDISGYTEQAVLAKLPALKAGNVAVAQMEGAPPLRKWAFDKRLVEFQTIQKRVEPLAIHIYSGVYNLQMLKDALPGTDYIVEKDGGYMLRIPIAVYPGAALVIKDLDKPLLLSQSKGAFIAGAGDVFIMNSTLVGWNDLEHRPATLDGKNSTFRPFLTMWDGTELYIVRSALKNMGYSLSKSYGLTVSTNDVIQEEFAAEHGDLLPPTGWIIDSLFENMYFGFYSYEAAHVAILRNTYRDNVIYGIDPHDRSHHLIIAYNKVSGSKKKHGIIISREVDDSWIFNNETRNNKGSGIMLDRNCVRTVVANNKSVYNHGDGITLYESPDNVLYNNVIENNHGSGIRIRNSWNIMAHGGSIAMNNGYAFEVYEDDLKGTSRDFDLDPVTTRAAGTFSGIDIESNAGIVKTGGFEMVRFININMKKQYLGNKPLGGDIYDLAGPIGKYIGKDYKDIRIGEPAKPAVQDGSSEAKEASATH